VNLSINNQSGFVLISVLLLIMVVSILGLTALKDSRYSVLVAANDQFYTSAIHLADSVPAKFIVDYNNKILKDSSINEDDLNSSNRNQLICFRNNQIRKRSLSSSELAKQDINIEDLECLDNKTDEQQPKSKTVIIDQGCRLRCNGFSIGIGVNTKKLACRYYKIQSKATVSNIKAVTELWVSVLEPCT